MLVTPEPESPLEEVVARDVKPVDPGLLETVEDVTVWPVLGTQVEPRHKLRQSAPEQEGVGVVVTLVTPEPGNPLEEVGAGIVGVARLEDVEVRSVVALVRLDRIPPGPEVVVVDDVSVDDV